MFAQVGWPGWPRRPDPQERPMAQAVGSTSTELSPPLVDALVRVVEHALPTSNRLRPRGTFQRARGGEHVLRLVVAALGDELWSWQLLAMNSSIFS